MDRDLLAKELERDEGLRLFPYKDSVGILTIGIGRNLDEIGISEAEARILLESDIARVERDLDTALPWWRKLDEDRQRVLVNMAFNLGADSTSPDPRKRKLLAFKNTLGAVLIGDYDGAAALMLKSKWAIQVGPRSVRLAARMRGDGLNVA
jgi:lysozyme